MGQVRLAELVAGLSLAADLGSGQPLEHTLRTCLRAVAIGRDLGLPGPQLRDVYYVSLLRFIGCTATSVEDAQAAGGDEIRFLAAMAPQFMGQPPQLLAAFARQAGRDLPPLRRAGTVLRGLADPHGVDRTITAHCEVASRLAGRLGMGPRIDDALRHAFERWDGHGIPGELSGDEVPLAVRVVVVARDAELWAAQADPDTAADVLRRRRGRAYAPDVVDAVLGVGPLTPADDDEGPIWERVLDAEPPPLRTIDEQRLDDALSAFADFADLKSPFTRGHSRGVAQLAVDAARAAGHDAASMELLRRAALVHDLGRVGIPLSVWDRPTALGHADRERVRLHPYLTERILATCTPLSSICRLAGSHHEQPDGAGYHRGCGPADLGPEVRILAAADRYQAMTQERAYRPARPPDDAAAELRRDGDARRVDPQAVAAVLEAAGHDAGPVRTAWPFGLTDREVEVLRLAARGRTNRAIAEGLVISPKTVGHHLEHVYTKIGVSTRAAAALFAAEHRLL